MLESLALKHAETIDVLHEVNGVAPRSLHVVGGGARNALLCSWTASAAGLPVLAGPEEATLVGNLLVQAMALGEIGSLREAREVSAPRSSPSRTSPSRPPNGRSLASVSQSSGRRDPGGWSMSATDVLGSIALPRNRWDASAVAGSSPLEVLTYRSNLLGADRALANIGGGNTSVKETTTDHVGRQVRVLWVKGSGTDLATITARGFRGVAPRRAASPRGAVGDGRQRRWSTTCCGAACARTSRVRRSRPCCTHSCLRRTSTTRIRTPSIALTSTPEGRRLAAETFGDEAVWLDYQRPGFDMSRRIASSSATIRRHERSCSSVTGS